MDYQPRPGVCSKKRARDRLIRLVEQHPDWVLGFEDEVWWSRFAKPNLHAWAEPGQPMRLVEQSVPKNDPDPKALACYGLLVRWQSKEARPHEEVWLRFVDGRPISERTTTFLDWSCDKLEHLGKTALLLVWDNATWHISRRVEAWITEHNCQVRRSRKGVRILVCPLPTKSPWLNPIEPKWIHAKRRVVNPDGLSTAKELAQRVCESFGCPYEEHLAIPEKVA